MDEIFTESRFGLNDSGNISQHMTMLLLKNISNKQAINPWYTSLISQHTERIFRNQKFHSESRLS